jgi:hypothetical protein
MIHSHMRTADVRIFVLDFGGATGWMRIASV